MKNKAISKPASRSRDKQPSVIEEEKNYSLNYEVSRENLSAIINSLEDELMVIDRNYRIIEANDAVLLEHGKSRQQVIGKYCYNISHGQHQPCRLPHHKCPLDEVWETGTRTRVTHCHFQRIKGEKREKYLDIIASPIIDSEGKVLAVSELMRDVTEAKNMERKTAKTHQNLLILHKIATTLSHSLDLDTVLGDALQKTLKIMKKNTGGILLWDKERRTLYYRIHKNLSKEVVQNLYVRPGEGIVGRVAQSGKTILVDDISKDGCITQSELIAAEGFRSFAAIPIQNKDKVLGVLTLASHDTRKFSPEDIQVLDSIAAQITIAVENAMLHQEVQRKDEIRGELLSEILSIQEEERRRIARELHDETSQSLASLAASLGAVIDMLPPNAEEIKSRIKKVERVATNTLDEIHKIIYELRPTLLDDLGLVTAIRWLADNNLATISVTVSFKTMGRVIRLPAQLETTLFRVIQEVISNITKHAHARNVDITLHFKKRVIAVLIKDNGEGFDVEEAISSENRPRGLGLLGMKERVELLNGTLIIRSHKGKGTKISIEIPMKNEISNRKDNITTK